MANSRQTIELSVRLIAAAHQALHTHTWTFQKTLGLLEFQSEEKYSPTTRTKALIHTQNIHAISSPWLYMLAICICIRLFVIQIYIFAEVHIQMYAANEIITMGISFTHNSFVSGYVFADFIYY